MSTNYYLHKPACASCSHTPAPLHIGLSAAGWVFALHVYPKEACGVELSDGTNTWDAEINDLDDWLPLFEQYEINTEYGELVTAEAMKQIITERHHANRLKRWPIEHLRVLGPGAGTWDRHIGEFS